MKLSSIYYQQFNAACQLKYRHETLNKLYIKWQTQLKSEGKYSVIGKKMAVLAW